MRSFSFGERYLVLGNVGKVKRKKKKNLPSLSWREGIRQKTEVEFIKIQQGLTDLKVILPYEVKKYKM